MAEKTHPKRSQEEWMNLIQECRTSGLSDKHWCIAHHISPSTFYCAVRRLRENACKVPERDERIPSPKQELVEISLNEAIPENYSSVKSAALLQKGETAVRIRVHGAELEITNSASSEIVQQILQALLGTC